MGSEILINVTQGETRVALLEGGQVVEFYIERKRDASLVGNIYKGKVVKILPGMQSAFVDIGLEKAAFLYVGDIQTDKDEFAPLFEDEGNDDSMDFLPRKGRSEMSIEEVLQEGQELLVQVSKDPMGSKGARVTSYLTFPGRYLVLMPDVDHVGISRRISNEDQRERLKEIVTRIRPEGYGLIIRTASEDSLEEDIKKDLEFLILLWENLKKKKDKVPPRGLLYSDLDLVFRSIRDLMTQNVERLVIDSAEEYNRITEFVKTYFSKLLEKIELYEETEPIFDAFGIELDIARAIGRRVWLKSGGYIVVDQTEAMTVIDVNTGKFVGKEGLEDTILKTNLEAVKEITYQIRLRNLGGIIIVDFIDMDKLENREKLFTAFTEAMKKDRAKNTILHISELGLIQMTRKRVRENLGRTLCTTCPYCEGKGFVKSPNTLCYEILRTIRKMARHGSTKIIITAHPLVAELLSDEEMLGIEDVERQYGVKVIIRADAKKHQENYEVTSL
jgi:ribonuclease G